MSTRGWTGTRNVLLEVSGVPRIRFHGYGQCRRGKCLGCLLQKSVQTLSLWAMANDPELNIRNNIRMRETQFVHMFLRKTL